jgi:hypothetical protein
MRPKEAKRLEESRDQKRKSSGSETLRSMTLGIWRTWDLLVQFPATNIVQILTREHVIEDEVI